MHPSGRSSVHLRRVAQEKCRKARRQCKVGQKIRLTRLRTRLQHALSLSTRKSHPASQPHTLPLLPRHHHRIASRLRSARHLLDEPAKLLSHLTLIKGWLLLFFDVACFQWKASVAIRVCMSHSLSLSLGSFSSLPTFPVLVLLSRG